MIFPGGAEDMKIRHNRILLGGLALLIAPFFSSTSVRIQQHQGENNGPASVLETKASMRRRDKITIVVEGDGQLARAIEKAVLAEFRKAGLENVELAQPLTPSYPNPVLLDQTRQS